MKKHSDPPKSLHIVIPESLWLEVKILLTDPQTGRIRYRSLSPLVAEFLRNWVNEQRSFHSQTEKKEV